MCNTKFIKNFPYPHDLGCCVGKCLVLSLCTSSRHGGLFPCAPRHKVGPKVYYKTPCTSSIIRTPCPIGIRESTHKCWWVLSDPQTESHTPFEVT
jgi:hypothetical protein